MTTPAVQEAWKDHFFLSTEEYLHSLISLVNELVSANPSELNLYLQLLTQARFPCLPQSRLAVNRVTLGDYGAPARYSRYAQVYPKRELGASRSLLASLASFIDSLKSSRTSPSRA